MSLFGHEVQLPLTTFTIQNKQTCEAKQPQKRKQKKEKKIQNINNNDIVMIRITKKRTFDL